LVKRDLLMGFLSRQRIAVLEDHSTATGVIVFPDHNASTNPVVLLLLEIEYWRKHQFLDSGSLLTTTWVAIE